MAIMCSRYEIDVSWEEIAGRFGLDEAPTGYTAGEIRPTNSALVVGAQGARSLRWGLPAPWSGKPLINARAETLQQKPTFQPLLENRCLVPASGYFEWRKDGKNRLKNRIGLKGDILMGFAGLYSEEYFTIITCEPSPSIAHIHNRMPVILSQAAKAEWCDRSKSFDQVRRHLKPFDSTALTATENVPPPPAQADFFS